MDVIHLLPYVYSPLPSPRHIRILVIQQAEDITAPLHAKLSNLGLDDEDRISYTALSYTWGVPELTEKLAINDAICQITPNLAGALRQLRLMGCIRVWADAVCIDQKNDVEKSLQIPLMASIYRIASRVLVWLGNKSEDIQLLKVVRSGCSQLRFSKTHPFPPELGEALHQLLQLPWFSRRWVIQELVLNITVSFLCGTVEIPFAWLAALVCDSDIDEDSREYRSIRSLQKLWGLWKTVTLPWKESNVGEDDDFGIMDLQKSFDHFECFDPRDRIFALLGIAVDINQDPLLNIDQDPLLDIDLDIFIEDDRGSDIDVAPDRAVFYFRPDYAKSTEMVYTDFALSIVREGFLNTVLQEAIARPRTSGQLPSWVPDWRVSLSTDFSKIEKYYQWGGDVYQFQPTQCGRYFTLTAPMLHSIILESETKTTAPPAYSSPMQIIWTSSPAHGSWNSWAAEAIVSAWEFIITGSQWMKSFTLETQEYTLKQQENLWIQIVNAVIRVAFDALCTDWKPLQLLGDDEGCMREIFIHPSTELREKMLRQCKREFVNESSVHSERFYDDVYGSNLDGSHIGWFFLSVVSMCEGVYSLSSAPPRMSSLIVEPGDEVLLFADVGDHVIRQVDSLDSKVPVYSIINISSKPEILNAKTVTNFRDAEYSALRYEEDTRRHDQKNKAVIQQEATFEIVLA